MSLIQKRRISILAGLVLLIIGSIYFLNTANTHRVYTYPVSQSSQQNNSAILAENVILHPERYSGTIDVDGTVNKIIDANNFTLGCPDACYSMPVQYKTDTLSLQENIIMTGQLSKQNGKYVFIASSIKQK